MTKTNLKLFAGIALSLAIAGCSMIKKSAHTGGGGGGDAKGPLGDTMADAVTYKRGDTINAPAGCHTSGYAKLDIPAGEKVKLTLTITTPKDEADISFSMLKSNGGQTDVFDEVSSTKSPKTYETTIPDGGNAQLQISEGGACQGASVSVAIE